MWSDNPWFRVGLHVFRPPPTVVSFPLDPGPWPRHWVAPQNRSLLTGRGGPWLPSDAQSSCDCSVCLWPANALGMPQCLQGNLTEGHTSF